MNEDCLDDCISGSEFINNLVAECKSLLVDGQRPNPYHCPDFATNIIRLAKLFPLWTAVMARDKSSVATSSYSEEYFREVKQLVLKGKSAVRVDKFLVMHMRSLAGTTKILHALHQGRDDALQPRRKKRKPNEGAFSEDDARLTKHEEVLSNGGDEFVDHAELTLSGNGVTPSEIRPSDEGIIQDEIMKREDKVTDDNFTTNKDKIMKSGVLNGTGNVVGVKDIGPPLILGQSIESLDTPGSKGTDDDYPVDAYDLKNGEDLNAHLNEKEIWKGKSRDKKKRGKFLRPCPDIQHRHGRPKSITSVVPLLKNGLLLGPVKMTNKNVIVRNTCPFDSISQSMVVAYRDWASYQIYITSTRNRFFAFVELFDKSGCTVKVYKERAEIMNQMTKIVGGVLDCMMNVSNLVKHLFKDEPSYTIDYHCESCNKDDQVQAIVVEVDVKPFYNDGVRCLQKVLLDQVQQNKNCAVCRSGDVTSTLRMGNHIIIDVECLQWTQLARNLGHPDWPGTLTIGQMPEKIEIANSTYTIQSVVEYVGELQSAEPCEKRSKALMGHYVAHVRRITGRWEVHNDIMIGGKSVMATARMLFEKKKFSLLIYIKTG